MHVLCRTTFCYAAPEQLSRWEVSKAIDIFSLGAAIFELIMGRRIMRYSTEHDASDAALVGLCTPQLLY